MKVSIEDRSSTEKQINVVIPAETVRLEREGIVRKIRRNAKVDGFRQGKVPEHEIHKRFADEIKEELVSNLVSNSFADALKEVSAAPVSRPAITPGDVDQEKEFSYSAVFDVLPNFELPEYKGIELKQSPISVTPEDVDRALEQIVEGSATVEPTKDKRPCAAEDVVEVDYNGTLDGKTVEGLAKDGVRFLLGKGQLLEEFEKNILGMSAGDEKEFEIAYPEDFQIEEAAGKSVKFTLKVTQVFDRTAPALDDEFAKKTGSENLADFKGKIEEDLKARLESLRSRSLEEQICSKLNGSQFEVPGRLVLEEKTRLEEEFKREHSAGGGKALSAEENEKLSESMTRRAGDNVKLSLVISKIAEAESIEAQESDLRERFEAVAAQSGVKAEQVREYYEKNSMLNGLNSQIVSSKVIAFVRENANIKTENPPPDSPKQD
ncbi:MAG: trigger factor [Thermodesulfobacteriota bacterium]